MAKNRSTLANLISTFNIARHKARTDAEAELWRRNKLDNPRTDRSGYEIRETVVNLDGTTIIRQQLWKKVDEIQVNISAKIEVEEKSGDDLKDLMA